jgi:glycine oxidase
MGAWTPAPVSPRKVQMLAVALPRALPLETVVRTKHIYIAPRTEGPNADRAIIGATVEDLGFDLTVHPRDILTLNAHATRLLPALAEATFLESWAGLRPATSDGLPILGATPRQPRYILTNGHFCNGILLAPATAHVVTQ